ncbi:serine protease [Actinoplanes sp. Pm04-4]|uniref:Serine protease n=1 Tax=Paractinoplanes pyxinae TaxID=2997416 RepID=A0ABT4B8D2_9ACTN|nr:serine protease [Actinoplanes pyxinae]MCY1142763.1 serine protease [Actinoplanes pyxinae]
MRLRRAFALAAATAAAITGVVAGPAPAQAVAATTLASTIALNNCSASLVRYPSSVSSDRAMMLTNGHCYEGGFLSAGQVLQNRTSSRSGSLLNSSGGSLGTVRADRVLYATMTGTDVALYRLTSTYATLSSRYGATALTIASSRPAAGISIGIPSSYWKRIWNCKIDSFVPQLREGEWTWRDSIRYDTACDTIHGTSGSPILNAATNQIVGINNTGNDDGQMCTLNNPCEVAADGTTRAYQGQSYGEQTYWFTTCLTSTRTIDLNKSGCLLTRP